MLAYTTGRVVVTPAASARSNARALRTPSGATARRGAILRVRVVGGGAATRRASHVAAALGSGDDDDEDLLTLIGLPRRTKLRARGPIPSAALWRSPERTSL